MRNQKNHHEKVLIFIKPVSQMRRELRFEGINGGRCGRRTRTTGNNGARAAKPRIRSRRPSLIELLETLLKGRRKKPRFFPKRKKFPSRKTLLWIARCKAFPHSRPGWCLPTLHTPTPLCEYCRVLPSYYGA